jgi:hypothetical protein
MENLDTNLRLWLTSRFDTIEKRLDGMLAAMDKMEKRHDVCRTHCDETSGQVFKRLGDLEQHDIRSDAEQTTRRGHEDRLLRLEEKGVQVDQSTWIRAGVIMSSVMAFLSFVGMLVTFHWGGHK